MLETLKKNHKKFITLHADFKKDLAWFNTFLPTFNGVTFFDKTLIAFSVHLDDCPTGLGGVYNESVYKIAPSVHTYDIVELEMLSFLAALRIWGKLWEK